MTFNKAANPVNTEGLVIARAAEDFGGESVDSHVGRRPVISLFGTNPVDENLLLIYGQSEPRFSAFPSRWNALKPTIKSRLVDSEVACNCTNRLAIINSIEAN